MEVVSPPHNNENMAVIGEELQSKIEENARLHSKVNKYYILKCTAKGRCHSSTESLKY